MSNKITTENQKLIAKSEKLKAFCDKMCNFTESPGLCQYCSAVDYDEYLKNEEEKQKL